MALLVSSWVWTTAAVIQIWLTCPLNATKSQGYNGYSDLPWRKCVMPFDEWPNDVDPGSVLQLLHNMSGQDLCFVAIVARMPGITLHFKTSDGSGSTRSPAALATWAFERHFAVCLAVRFGIGATSPSPSWDSQAGYLWMEFSETKKEWRLILMFWYVMLRICWQIWSWQCKNIHHRNTQGKSSMS